MNAQNQVVHSVTILSRRFTTTLTLSMWIPPISVQIVQLFVQPRMQCSLMDIEHTRTSKKKHFSLATCSLFCNVFPNLPALNIEIKYLFETEREAADAQINLLLNFNPLVKRWFCVSCDYNHQARQVVYKHVDSKHMDIVYKCDICHKLSPTQHALSEHVRSIHKQMQSPY